MTDRTDYEEGRALRPKRKRPKDSRPESERRRKRPSETPSVTAADRRDSSLKEGAREQRSPSQRRRAEQEEAARRQRALRRRRRRRFRRRLYRALLVVLAVVLVVSAAMIARELLKRDKLKGAWTLDESTSYEFDGQGGGTLRLPLGSYTFTYTVEENVVALDFADEAVADASYSFAIDGKTLTLDTNTGTVYRLEK